MAEATIEELFRAHWSLVLGFLVRQTRDVHLAEEIAQETFVRATRAFLGWKGGSAAAWLLTIARNTLIDHVRKHSRTVVVADVPESPFASGPSDVSVRDALDRLPERVRRLLTLHYFDGFSLAEIAAMSNSTEGAVKTAIHRARRQFSLEDLRTNLHPLTTQVLDLHQPVLAFQEWAQQLKGSDDALLRELGLPKSADLKQIAANGKIAGFVVRGESPAQVQALLHRSEVKDLTIADVVLDTGIG